MDVGGLLFMGDRCLGNPGNVLAQFVAAIGLGHLICTFVVVLANSTANVLLVDFVVLDEPFKIHLGFHKVILDGLGLVFPLCHLCLAKEVQGVHLFEVELEYVNGDVEPLDGTWSLLRHLLKAVRCSSPTQSAQYVMRRFFFVWTSSRHHWVFRCSRIWMGVVLQ